MIEKMKDAAANDALNDAEKVTSLGKMMIINISITLLWSYLLLEEEIFTLKKNQENLEEEISGIINF